MPAIESSAAALARLDTLARPATPARSGLRAAHLALAGLCALYAVEAGGRITAPADAAAVICVTETNRAH